MQNSGNKTILFWLISAFFLFLIEIQIVFLTNYFLYRKLSVFKYFFELVDFMQNSSYKTIQFFINPYLKLVSSKMECESEDSKRPGELSLYLNFHPAKTNSIHT